jgi:hypothetical protein
MQPLTERRFDEGSKVTLELRMMALEELVESSSVAGLGSPDEKEGVIFLSHESLHSISYFR